MSDKAIDKAVRSSVSNIQIETQKITDEEIELIKRTIVEGSGPRSLLYRLFKLDEEKKVNQKKK